VDYNYPHFDSPFIQALYNWQTLIGVGAALVGAVLIWRQIKQAERQETERIRRRFVGARAGMPLFLSAVSSYAREVATFLRGIHAPAGQHAFGAPNLAQSAPILPVDISPGLQTLIEVSPDEKLANTLARLLGELQVLNSRITDIPNLSAYMTGLQLTVEDYMLQVARIYASAANLYDYARGETDTLVARDATSLFSALNLLELRSHEFERLHETAARREQRRLHGASAAD